MPAALTAPLNCSVAARATRADLRAALDERDKLIARLEHIVALRDQSIAELDRQNRIFAVERLQRGGQQEKLVQDLRAALDRADRADRQQAAASDIDVKAAKPLGSGCAAPAPPPPVAVHVFTAGAVAGAIAAITITAAACRAATWPLTLTRPETRR